MLTIAGLVLSVWFVQMLLLPGPAPLTGFVVAAMAVAMLSVGLRYMVKARNKTPDDRLPDDRLPGDRLEGDKRS